MVPAPRHRDHGNTWDHVNVFPTEENYIEQFRLYLNTVEPCGTVVHCNEDALLNRVVDKMKLSDPTYNGSATRHPHTRPSPRAVGSPWTMARPRTWPYRSPQHANLVAARRCCEGMGMETANFDRHMVDFTGAARRLEVMREDLDAAFVAFRDFAHAPSKLRATQASVVGQFPDRSVTAVFELYTFSSLNRAFIPQYRDALNEVTTRWSTSTQRW